MTIPSVLDNKFSDLQLQLNHAQTSSEREQIIQKLINATFISIEHGQSSTIGNSISLFQDNGFKSTMPKKTEKAILSLALTRLSENAHECFSTIGDLTRFLRVALVYGSDLPAQSQHQLVANVQKLLQDPMTKGPQAAEFRQLATFLIAMRQPDSAPAELKGCPFYHASASQASSETLAKLCKQPAKLQTELSNLPKGYCSHFLKPGQYLVRPSSNASNSEQQHTCTFSWRLPDGALHHCRAICEKQGPQTIWKWEKSKNDKTFTSLIDLIDEPFLQKGFIGVRTPSPNALKSFMQDRKHVG